MALDNQIWRKGKRLMKKLITLILALMVAGTAFGQGNYRYVFESGDTLVSSTNDTSTYCLLYNGSTETTRPIRPTLYIDVTEIGTNTSHYWLQYDVAVAMSNIAKDASGWYPIYSEIENDWGGFATNSQNDIAIPMPFLESYGALYFRVILSYPSGVGADSTSYKLTYGADETGNMYSPPEQLYKIIPHKKLFRTGAEQLCDSADVSQSTDPVDLRMEITSGRYVLPTRVVLQTGAGRATGAGTADDSLTVYVTPYYYHREGAVTIDTVTIPLNGAAELSFSLAQGTGMVEAVLLEFFNENLGTSDSTYFYAQLGLEYRP